MRAAGLDQVEENRQTTELIFADSESLLSAQIDAGPVALAAKRFSPKARREVESAFLESVLKYRHADGSYAIPGEFLTVMGVC